MYAADVIPPPGAADLAQARRHFIRWHLAFDRWIGWALASLFLIAIVPIALMVYWISVRALPTMGVSTFTTNPVTPFFVGGGAGGLLAPIVGTAEIIGIATVVAILLGLFGGIAAGEFLSERTASWMRLGANTLAGMPAIIIGYTGFLLFVTYAGWGLSLIAGAVTTALFMTPYVFRAADLGFSSVPRHIREAAYGSGARPMDYVVHVARPIAMPAILNGIFLAVALGLGETATLIFTVNNFQFVPEGIFGPAGFLTYIVFTGFNSPYPSQVTQAFQAAFLLIVAVIILNVIIRVISARSTKRLEGLFT